MSTLYYIQLSNRKNLEFRLTRKRMRNIVMRINPDGLLAISAPHCVSLNEISKFILSRQTWIEKTRQKLARTNEITYLPLEIKHAAQLMLLGKVYSLEIIPSAIQGIFIQDNKIYLHTRTPDNKELTKAVFNKWLQEYTATTLNDLLNLLHPRLQHLDIHLPILRIREMKSSWGLCRLSQQTITLNSSLIHVPLSCLEYVILHELTHLKHFNHSKEFYSLLEQVCPDWQAQKQLLRKYVGALHKVK